MQHGLFTVLVRVRCPEFLASGRARYPLACSVFHDTLKARYGKSSYIISAGVQPMTLKSSGHTMAASCMCSPQIRVKTSVSLFTRVRNACVWACGYWRVRCPVLEVICSKVFCIVLPFVKISAFIQFMSKFSYKYVPLGVGTSMQR